MTVQEAIKDMQNQLWEINTEGSDVVLSTESLKLAINALIKQIPIEPIYRSCRCEDGFDETWICPNCKIDLDANHGLFRRHVDKIRYCELCGQRIDWNEKWNY